MNVTASQPELLNSANDDAMQQQVSGCVNDVSCHACVVLVAYLCVNKKLVV